MRKTVILMVVLLCSVVFAAGGLAESKMKMELKGGDEVYVCNCAEGCPCDTVSMKEGDCTCGNTLVKGVVKSVAEGKAMIEVDGKEREFNIMGKHACACPAGCTCNTVAQVEGKCPCGVEMKAVQ